MSPKVFRRITASFLSCQGEDWRGAFGRRMLGSRSEFDFERMVFLESANTEQAKTDNTAFFVYAFHNRIAFSRSHVAVSGGKSHFEVIHIWVNPRTLLI